MERRRLQRFQGLPVPMSRLAFEIGMKLERQAWMAGSDQIMIDNLRLPGFLARPHMALHARRRTLIEVVFCIDEARRVAMKARAIMRMQPLPRQTMTRLAAN